MTLKISEMFYSIQGEGISAGVPAVFLRLSGCNLLCKGDWDCDTITVWQQGKKQSHDDILKQWQDQGWLDHLEKGAHLVITGGEPLLHDSDLCHFLEQLKKQLKHLHIEIETNGTLTPSNKLDAYISQYNVSPKLKNSGMPEEKRKNKAAITFFINHPSATFKFVVSKKACIKEIQNEWQHAYRIPREKLLLMPACDTRKTLEQQGSKVAEWCKQYNLRFSPRLHLSLWDQKTGV